jgi:AraC-like DNA-binding protein
VDYREYAPAPNLAEVVDRYWSLDGWNDAPEAEPLLPDGHSEIIVHMADPFAGQGRELWAGQLDRAVTLTPSRRVCAFGVRFRPFGAWAFTGFSQEQTVGQIIALDSVWIRDFAERIGNAPSIAARVAAADSYLTALRRRAPDTRLTAAVAIIDSDPFARIDDVARDVACGRRHLERLFRRQVGLTPKSLGLIFRLQRSVRIRRARPDWTWSRIAAEAGYYDQSHLIGDFHRIGGEAPSELLRAQADFASAMVRDGGAIR